MDTMSQLIGKALPHDFTKPLVLQYASWRTLWWLDKAELQSLNEVQHLQIFDILALLNVMKLLTFPAIQSTEQKDTNKTRDSGGEVAQNADSLRQYRTPIPIETTVA